MTSYLLSMLLVFSIVVTYCLFVGLYDRRYEKPAKKRDWLIGIVTIALGIFSGDIASAYYLDGWSVKYLAPVLIFAVATAAVIVYICLLKRIYAAKGAAVQPKESEGETGEEGRPRS